jgi:hypothetical protein
MNSPFTTGQQQPLPQVAWGQQQQQLPQQAPALQQSLAAELGPIELPLTDLERSKIAGELAQLTAAARALQGIPAMSPQLEATEARRTELQRMLHKAKPLSSRSEVLNKAIVHRQTLGAQAYQAEQEAAAAVLMAQRDQQRYKTELDELVQEKRRVDALIKAEEEAAAPAMTPLDLLAQAVVALAAGQSISREWFNAASTIAGPAPAAPQEMAAKMEVDSAIPARQSQVIRIEEVAEQHTPPRTPPLLLHLEEQVAGGQAVPLQLQPLPQVQQLPLAEQPDPTASFGPVRNSPLKNQSSAMTDMSGAGSTPYGR